jgi:hypothetical protein
MKKCYNCKVDKALDCFHKDSNQKDGLRSKCKDCRKNKTPKVVLPTPLIKCCTKCKEIKNIKEFSKDKKGEFGAKGSCKNCVAKRMADYYVFNKEKLKTKTRNSYSNNKNNCLDYAKEYRLKNKNKISIKAKKYNSLKEVKKKRNLRSRLRYKNDLNYKIGRTLDSSLREALLMQGALKADNVFVLTSCTLEFLIKYLESHMTHGMTWDNHKIDGWHIDHILPKSSFNLLDFEQQRLCFHYTNLKPRWATTKIAISYGEKDSYVGNIEKGNKVNLLSH